MMFCIVEYGPSSCFPLARRACEIFPRKMKLAELGDKAEDAAARTYLSEKFLRGKTAIKASLRRALRIYRLEDLGAKRA